MSFCNLCKQPLTQRYKITNGSTTSGTRVFADRRNTHICKQCHTHLDDFKLKIMDYRVSAEKPSILFIESASWGYRVDKVLHQVFREQCNIPIGEVNIYTKLCVTADQAVEVLKNYSNYKFNFIIFSSHGSHGNLSINWNRVSSRKLINIVEQYHPQTIWVHLGFCESTKFLDPYCKNSNVIITGFDDSIEIPQALSIEILFIMELFQNYNFFQLDADTIYAVAMNRNISNKIYIIK